MKNADEALAAGADLWVIKNDSENAWWQELDFRSGFLLSHSLSHLKKTPSLQLKEILEQTELKTLTFQEDEEYLLLGSSDHFLNKWVLLWNKNSEALIPHLEKIAPKLKVNSVRIFSNAAELKPLVTAAQARPKASLPHITFIENA